MDYRREKLRLATGNDTVFIRNDKAKLLLFLCTELLADDHLAHCQVLLVSTQLESSSLCSFGNLIVNHD